MKATIIVFLVFVVGSLQSIASDIVEIKPAASAIKTDEKTNDNNLSAFADGVVNNGTSPCDRYLRSAEVELRNPRNHKFVTSNGWTERQRPRPEINVYSRIEELPSPRPPPGTATTSTSEYYHQQQRNSLYQDSRQQQPPTVRTSKRIIYYATLPDVTRSQTAGHPPPPSYPTDPYRLTPGPYSADFRQIDSNRNSLEGSQRTRLLPYENVYNRGNGITSVTSKSVSTVYNGKYDEPAEFRDSYYRPNEFTSKFASWAEPFYKSWSSSSWDKEPPSYNNNKGGSSSLSSWDREPIIKGGGSWDNRGSSWDGRGSSWDSKGYPWENRGSSWDKELVEVPLQKPNGVGSRGGDGYNNFSSDKYPEVAIVQSGVIDVRGDRKQNGLPLQPPPRFTIVDVDQKPYYQPQQMRYDEHIKPMQHNMQYEPPMQHNMQYEPPMQHMQYEPPPQKPMRYEAYTPMEPPTRYEQQLPPSSMRFEQQYRPSPSPTRHGQQQNHNKEREPSNSYYETIKNNIRTHQLMTSWTEVSNQDDVSPTQSSLDVDTRITSHGNFTSVQNNTGIRKIWTSYRYNLHTQHN